MKKIFESMDEQIKTLDNLIVKTKIKGSYFRMQDSVNDDFTRKCKDSEVQNKPGQSKRDVIAEKLAECYAERGDEMLKTLNINSL